MSLGLVVLIVAAVVLVALAAVLLVPRARAGARHARAERELQGRRDRAAEGHREEAAAHEQRAERAEREARMAEQVAERERADAGIHAERAELHGAGAADDELIADDERERFDAVTGEPAAPSEERRFARDADPDASDRDRAERAAEEAPPERLRRR